MDTKTILGITIFILIGSLVVFSFTFAQNRSLTPCVKDWDTSSTPEQIKCIEQIGGYRQIQETRSALQEQTIQARPSALPGSGLQTETALFQTVGLPEPTPTPNATEVQAALTKITPVERRLFTSGGTIPTLDYKYMASIWRVGAIIVDTTIIVSIFMSTPKEGCQIVIVRRRTPEEQIEVQNPQVTADTFYLPIFRTRGHVQKILAH